MNRLESLFHGAVAMPALPVARAFQPVQCPSWTAATVQRLLLNLPLRATEKTGSIYGVRHTDWLLGESTQELEAICT